MAVQTSAQPTRKVTTMLIGTPAIYALLGPAVTEVWPQIVAPAFAGESMTALVSALPAVLISALIAYYVPDAPNRPTPDEVVPRL